MDFKPAAVEVLWETGRSLHYADTTEVAMEQDYLDSTGATPQNTMRTRISSEVRDNPDSPFLRAATGVFGLREWGR